MEAAASRFLFLFLGGREKGGLWRWRKRTELSRHICAREGRGELIG